MDVKNKNKSILFINIYGGGQIQGGTETYLHNLICKLREKDQKSKFFFAFFNKINSPILKENTVVKDSIMTRFMESWNFLKLQNTFSIIGWFAFLWGIFWLYRTSTSLVKKNKIDLIYANGGQVSAIVAYLIYKKYHINYLLHFHGIFDFSNFFNKNELSPKKIVFEKITKKYLINAQKIIANSRDVADDLKGIKSIKLNPVIVHCFVDENQFFPQNQTECRKTLQLAQNDFIILSVNRMEKDKRIHFFLEVIKKINNPNIKFIFIGDGELKNDVIRLSQFQENVIYIPPTDNQKIPLHINSSNLVIGATSKYYLSLTLIEAIACGVPIISSNIPVSHDTTHGQITAPTTLPKTIGYLVDENISSVSKLILQLSKNPKELANKKIACLNFYQKTYGENNFNRIRNIIYN